MKQLIKSWMYAVAPRAATAFFSMRARATSHRAIAGWGCLAVNEALLSRFGDRVLGGPFAGLVLPPIVRAEQIGPYLLGIYEDELAPAWEPVLKGHYDQVVDVGAKFGYYAAGLARRFPASRVVAFDTDPWARRAVREVVRANGVTNVEVRGYCDPAWLAGHLGEAALVISDCEGFEGELLCTRPIPNLRSATLIVEVHEVEAPGVKQRLRDRLGATHRLTEIATGPEPRPAPEGLDLGFLDECGRFLATQEVRPPQTWLLALPDAGPGRPA